MKKIFFKFKTLVSSLLILSLFLASCAFNQQDKLPRANESELNYDFDKFDQVFSDVWSNACNELHSMMVIKDGKVIYEKYATGHTPEELHILWSASKTFTATAIGFAVQDGLLSTDDKIIQFFTQEELPTEISPWLAEMTVHDLLCMSSGFSSDFISEAVGGQNFNWAKETLASEIKFEPGTWFSYNSMDTYLLSVIFSRVTGQRVDEYLDTHLFKPLGIKEWHWDMSPQGYTAGGWGLYLTLESFAKMGQFILQKGEWNGKQLLDSTWFDKATAPHTYDYDRANAPEEEIKEKDDSDGKAGYAYQMWRGRFNSVRLDGAHGQLCIIIPDKNTVIAVFQYNRKQKDFYDSMWENIYPQL